MNSGERCPMCGLELEFHPDLLSDSNDLTKSNKLLCKHDQVVFDRSDLPVTRQQLQQILDILVDDLLDENVYGGWLASRVSDLVERVTHAKKT